MSDEELYDLDQAGSNSELSDDKRALHNLMERKRRDSIKDSFRSLQDAIPSLKGSKSSRAHILKKTGDHITFMQKKCAHDQRDINQIKNENQQLEAEIAALERAQATGNYASTGSILNLETLFTVSGSTDKISIEELENEEGDVESDNDFADDDEEDSDILDDIVPQAANVVTVPSFVSSSAPVPMRAGKVQPGQSLLLTQPVTKKFKR